MENTQITLTLTAKQVNIILAHLSKGIFGDVVELVNLIISQGSAQIAEVKKPADDTVVGTTETPAAPPAPPETEAKPDTVN